MNLFKDKKSRCAWCDSKDIEYERNYQIYDGELIKFKILCNLCGRSSHEIYYLEFVETKRINE